MQHTMEYFIVNGKIINITEIQFNLSIFNPTFHLSQKIWYGFGGIPYFYENINELNIQAHHLNIPIPPELKNKRELFRITKRMLNKNKFYRSGLLNFQLFSGQGTVQSIITCTSSPQFNFPFPSDGLLATFCSQKKYSKNSNNHFFYFNNPIWESAIAEIKDTYYEQAIILNEKEEICECAYGNIFMIKGTNLYTPPLSSGCYHNILRFIVLKSIKELGFHIIDNKPISIPLLFDMDEIFSVSYIFGIQGIMGIDNKRYISRHLEDIYNKLDNILKINANS